MADNYKVLAQGQLAAAAGAIYTVPGATQAIVRGIVIVNTDTTTRTISLFVNGTGAANKILSNRTLAQDERLEINGVITLAAAGTIQGVADVGAKVTYTISGLEIA